VPVVYRVRFGHPGRDGASQSLSSTSQLAG